MAENYYQKEIETMSREDMKKLQSEKLVKQVKHVYDNVPYYRNLMDEKGVSPDDIKSIDDLHKLPFLTKADLRDAYPYGLLATPVEDCVRIHSTSGTTGRRVVAFYTQKDVDLWEDCCARAIARSAARRRTCVRSLTATDFSRAASVLTAALTRLVVLRFLCPRARPKDKCSL